MWSLFLFSLPCLSLGDSSIPVILKQELQDNVVYTDTNTLDSNYIQHIERVDSNYVGVQGGVRGAIQKLDKQFLYLLSKIAGLVDPTVESLSDSCSSSRLQTQTYGWALLVGATKDTASDYIGNGRMPLDVLTMPDVIYRYGFNYGYGIGFAAPYLLPTYLGDCTGFTCTSQDFLSVVSSYSLSQGLAGFHGGQARMYNFGVDAKQSLDCVISQKGDSKEAAEIEYAIDDLVEAGLQRLKLAEFISY